MKILLIFHILSNLLTAERNVEEQREKDRNENLGRSAESQFAGKQLNESA